VTGTAGALLIGLAATRVCHRHHALNGILRLCIWLTAPARAAAVLPPAYPLITVFRAVAAIRSGLVRAPEDARRHRKMLARVPLRAHSALSRSPLG
jgi:hypothetical protein